MNDHHITKLVSVSALNDTIGQIDKMISRNGCTDYMFSNYACDNDSFYIMRVNNMTPALEKLMSNFLKSIGGVYDVRVYGHSVNQYSGVVDECVGFHKIVSPVKHKGGFYVAIRANQTMVCYLMANIFRDFSMTDEYLKEFPFKEEVFGMLGDPILKMMSYMSIFYSLYMTDPPSNNFIGLIDVPPGPVSAVISSKINLTSHRSSILRLLRGSESISRSRFKELIKSGYIKGFYPGMSKNMHSIWLKYRVSLLEKELSEIKVKEDE